MSRLRAIAGFTWRGWALLPVLLALAACALAGVDLRLRLMLLVSRWQGLSVLDSLVQRFFVPYAVGLRGALPGPACLLYVLPAMHLAPVRWRWWHWCAMLAVTLASPYYSWALVVRLQRSMGATQGVWWAVIDSVVFDGLFVALGWALTRSRRVVSGLTMVSLLGACASVLLEWKFSTGALAGKDPFPFLAGAWHIGNALVLLSWARRERLAYAPVPGKCAACGYDISGTRAPRCPECGLPRPA